MRFSILTLDLGLSAGPTDGWLESLSLFIADNNVSCVCIQNCAAPAKGRTPAAGTAPARTTRTAENSAPTAIAAELARLGLKYDVVWDWSPGDRGRPDCGSAVLTQLPIVGSVPRSLSHPEGRPAVIPRDLVAARLGLSPEIIIDVYSVLHRGVEIPDPSADRLVTFVDESIGLLEAAEPPPARRRGRPPRVRKEARRPDPVRMVFIAGRFVSQPGEGVCRELCTAGFSEASAGVPQLPGHDAIFLRPGLRATEARRVFTDGSLGDRTGLLLAFEL